MRNTTIGIVSLLLLLVGWECIALIVWKRNIESAIKKETARLEELYEDHYKHTMNASDMALEADLPFMAYDLLNEARAIRKTKPSSIELSQQAEQNVRQRGNPYSLFR